MSETSMILLWVFILVTLVLIFLGIGYIALIVSNQKRFISLQKKDLAILRKIEKRYSDLFNNVSDLMFIHSLSGKILLTNAAVKRLLGYEVDELVGKSIKYICHPKYHSQVDKYLESIENRGEAVGLMSVKGKSGNTYILEYRNSLITQNDRPIGVRGVARNVTEQMRTEAALKESEQRFRRLVKYSPIPILVELQGTLVYVNDTGMKLFAATDLGDIIGKTVNHFIHPDFWTMVENKFSDSTIETNRDPVEVKIVRCDGEVRDVEIVAISTIYLEHPARQIVFRDITERKQAEEEVNVLAHAIKGISECVSISDLGDNILFVNEAFTRTYGFVKEELIGKNVSVVYSPKNDPEILSEILPATLNGGWRGELWNRRKDGSEFPVFLSTSVVHDDQGKPFAFIRSVTDITERKRAEERIFQLNRLYAVLSHINEAIVRIYDIEKLYQEACRIAVKDGGFRLAWIGVVDHDTGLVKPVAHFGFEDGYLQHIPSSIKNVSEDPGPTEYAIRNKKYFILNDIGAVPAVSGWRAGAIQRGYQSIAAFPLQIGTRVETVINLYSEKKDFFSIEEVKLLDELASDISFALESRKAEDQLRKLSYAVEQSPISVIITDKGGNIEYINPKFTEVTGYTFEEVIGKNPKILKSGNVPEIEYQRLWKTILSGKEWHGEFHNKKKNGEFFWESASISPISDPDGKITHFLAVKEDITERKRAEKTIRESEDRYRSLVESSPEAILVEQNGNIVFVNPSGLNLLGYQSVNELNRMSLAGIFDKNPGNRPYSIFKSNDPKQFPTSVDGKFVRKDGNLIDVSLTVIHTTFQGKPALQLLARDITETKNLRQAAQRMEQLAALGQLSASIAHEIRNPLAAISLNIQLLSNQISIPEEFKDTVNDMTIGVQRIQDIIKGILSFARPAKLTAKNEDIHKVLESSIRAVENDFQKAGITIVKNFGDISSIILIDANQIIEVFVNLFLNAKDALQQEGKLTIQTNVVQDFLEVQVEDTGKGIAPENLEKVFNPFFTTKTKGMGLGLAIVYRILEQHQAKIFVESEVGVGTSFRIHFPLT